MVKISTKLVLLVVAIVSAVTFGRIFKHSMNDAAAYISRIPPVAEENQFLIERLGKPLNVSWRKNDPWKVSTDEQRRHSGYYTVDATGSKASDTLKIFWRETAQGGFEIVGISRTAPFKSDVELWSLNQRP